MANPIAFSGARAIFYINNIIVGWARDCDGTEAIALTPIDVIGSLAPLDYQATGYTVNFRARLFRLLGKNLKSLGIFPKYDDILTSGQLSCRIEDRYTGEVIVNIINVRARDINWTNDARGIFMQNVSFVGIRDIAGEI